MPNTPSFLVIGNAVAETVTRTEDGAVRAHAGGVGAIMARELALAGANVTLLTTAIPGPALDDLRQHLAEAGVRLDANTGDPPQRMHGQVHIRCRRGEFAGASGEWVRMGGLGRRITEIAPDYGITLVSLNLMPGDLQAAVKHSRRLIANATSPKLASRLLRLKGLTAATLNTREMGALGPHFRKKPKAGEMPSLLAAEKRPAHQGRTRDESVHSGHGQRRRRAAGPAGNRLRRRRRRGHRRPGLGTGKRPGSAGHSRGVRKSHPGQERTRLPIAVEFTNAHRAGDPNSPPRTDSSNLRHRTRRLQDPQTQRCGNLPYSEICDPQVKAATPAHSEVHRPDSMRSGSGLRLPSLRGGPPAKPSQDFVEITLPPHTRTSTQEVLAKFIPLA